MPDNFDVGFEAGGGFTRRHLLQLLLLISVVPVQYFITRSSSETSRTYELQNVLTGLSQLKTKYFNISYWTKLCTNLLGVWTGRESATTTPMPETITTGQQLGMYGTSMDVRSPRPPFVKYRIGQVVRHKSWKYRGVIVGWDEEAKAPDSWLNEMHPKDKPEWRKMPNYAVLVDTRDRLAPQMSYVVQDNIEVETGKVVFHPLIEYYFEHFDGTQYMPRPWLKTIYPND